MLTKRLGVLYIPTTAFTQRTQVQRGSETENEARVGFFFPPTFLPCSSRGTDEAKSWGRTARLAVSRVKLLLVPRHRHCRSRGQSLVS